MRPDLGYGSPARVLGPGGHVLSVVVGWLALVIAPAFAQDGDPGASPSLSAVPAASADPPVPPDLRGDWRFELVVVSHASVPILGTTVV